MVYLIGINFNPICKYDMAQASKIKIEELNGIDWSFQFDVTG